jgi:hypothetical protein
MDVWVSGANPRKAERKGTSMINPASIADWAVATLMAGNLALVGTAFHRSLGREQHPERLEDVRAWTGEVLPLQASEPRGRDDDLVA